MATIVYERGGIIEVSHSEPGYTGGHTVSQVLSIVPASVVVHVGLARIVGTIHGPVGAAVGISQFTYEDNGLQTVHFGNHLQWETALYHDRVREITISAYVHRGHMRAWWFVQVWG